MGLFRRKPKFIYELSGSSQFKDIQVTNTKDLRDYLVQENHRFRQEYLEGEVCVTKVKNDLSGKVYVEKGFILPQKEDFNWSEALSDFSTKKPLVAQDTMQSLINQDRKEKESIEETPKTELTLEEFEGTLTTEKEATVTTIDTSSTERSEITKTEEHKSEVVQLTKQELDALYAEILAQKEETARLRKEVEEPVQIASTEYHETEEKMGQSEPVIPVSIPEPLTQEKDQAIAQELTVPELLRTTKSGFDQALSDFLHAETTKIEQEIARLDKRGTIKQQVTERLQIEETVKIEQLTRQLTDEKEQLLQEEDMRHKQRRQEILSMIEEKRREQHAAIQTNIAEKTTKTIQEEYQEQTDQLSKILQGKLEELQVRQQTMNDGLKANFEETLHDFNLKHKRVMEEVERKKQETPIDLEEKRKQKLA